MMTRKLKKLSSAIKVWHLACAGALVGQVISPMAFAGPKGGLVTGGEGDISVDDLTTIVDQKSDLLSIDWESFNISEEELVEFLQPNSSSVVLNRILDQSPSEIRGSIRGNGHVILANPRGVLFTETATVNVGSITAAGLDMDPADFHNGDFSFTAEPGSAGVVVNRGVINAASAVLVGRQVTNAPGSLISAELVSLSAADEAVLTFDIDGLIGVQVTKAVMEKQMGVDSAVLNQGTIEGTQVLMEASVSGDLFTAAVNNDGVVRAQGIDTSGGVIRLTGSGSGVANSGMLDASGSVGGDVVLEGDGASNSGAITVQASAGTGGDVKLLGDVVQVSGSVDARGSAGGGEVLIGGGYQGQNSAVRNADSTTVTTYAVIDASGTGNGDGGTVVVWADGDTEFAGSIYAEGGELGGNGGLVETSGKRTLKLDNDALYVSTRANGEGIAGTWLLDPTWLEIAESCTDVVNCFEVQALEQLLPSSETVRIFAGAGPGEVGDDDLVDSDTDAITISAGLTWNSASTLELIADGNIQIEAGVSLSATLGSLEIDTTSAGLADPDNLGDFNLGSGASINVSSLTLALARQFSSLGSITTNNFDLQVGLGLNELGEDFDTENNLGSITIGEGGAATIRGGEGKDTFTANTPDETFTVANTLAITGDNVFTLDGAIDFSGVEIMDLGAGTDIVSGIDADADSGILGQNWLVTADGIETSGVLLKSAEQFSAVGSSLQIDSGMVTSNHTIALARREPEGEDPGLSYVSYAGYEFSGLDTAGQVLDVDAGTEVSADLHLDASGWDEAVSLTGNIPSLSGAGTTFSNITSATAGIIRSADLDEDTQTSRADELSISGANALNLLNAEGVVEIAFDGVSSVEADSADVLTFDSDVTSDNRVLSLTLNDNEVSYLDSLTVSGITDVTATGLEDFEPAGTGVGPDTIFTLMSDSQVSANGITFNGLQAIDAGTGNDSVQTDSGIADGATWALGDATGAVTLMDGASPPLAFTGMDQVDAADAVVDGTQNSVSEEYRLDDSDLSVQRILFTSASEVNSSLEESETDIIETSSDTFNLRTNDDETQVFEGGVSINGVDFSGIDEVTADSAATVVGTTLEDTFRIIARDNGSAANTGVLTSSIDFLNIDEVEGGAEDSIVTDLLTIDNGNTSNSSPGNSNKFSGITFSKDITDVSATTIRVLDSVNAEWRVTGDGTVVYSYSIDGVEDELEFGSVEIVEAGSGADSVTGLAGESWTISGLNSASNSSIDFSNVEQVSANQMPAGSAGFLSDQYTITAADIDGDTEYGVTSHGVALTGSNTFDSADPGTNYASLDGSALSKAVMLGSSDYQIAVEDEAWSFSNIDRVTARILETSVNDLQFTVGEETSDLTVSTSSISFAGLSEVRTGDTANNQLFTRSDVSVFGADGSLVSNEIMFTGIDSVVGFTESGSTTTYEIIGSESAETFAIVGDSQVNWIVGDSYTVSFSDVTGIDAGEAPADQDPDNPVIDEVLAIGTVTLTGNSQEAQSDSNSDGDNDILLSNIDKITGGNLTSSGVGDTYEIGNGDEVSVNQILFSGLDQITGASVDDEVVITASDVVWNFDEDGNVTFGDWVFENILNFTAEDSTLNGPADLQEFALGFDEGELVVDVVRNGLSDTTFKGLVSVNGDGSSNHVNASALSNGLHLTGNNNEVRAQDITFTGIGSATTQTLIGTSAGERFVLNSDSNTVTKEGLDIDFDGVTAIEGYDTVGSTDGGTDTLVVSGNNTAFQFDGQNSLTFDYGTAATSLSASLIDAVEYAENGSGAGSVTGVDNADWRLGSSVGQVRSSGITFTGVSDFSAVGGTLTGSDAAETFELFNSAIAPDEQWDVRVGGLTFEGLTSIFGNAVGSGSTQTDTVSLAVLAEAELTGIDGEADIHGLQFKEIEEITNATVRASAGTDRFSILGNQHVSANNIEFQGISSISTLGEGDQVSGGTGWALTGTLSQATNSGITFTGLTSVNADGQTLVGTENSDTYTLSSVTEQLAQLTAYEITFTGLESVLSDSANIGGDTLIATDYTSALQLTETDGELRTVDSTLSFSGLRNVEVGALQGTEGEDQFLVRMLNDELTTTANNINFTNLSYVDAGSPGIFSNSRDVVEIIGGNYNWDWSEFNWKVFDTINFDGIELFSGEDYSVSTTEDDDEITVIREEGGEYLIDINGTLFDSPNIIDAKDGDDTVVGAADENWILTGFESAQNGTFTFTDVEFLIANNAALVGLDTTETPAVDDSFELMANGHIRTQGMEVSGMTAVNAGGGVNHLDASSHVGNFHLTGTARELSTDIELLFTGIDTAVLATLNTTSASENLSLNTDGELLVGPSGISFTGLSTVIDQGGSDTLTGVDTESWSLSDNGAGVTHGGILFSAIESFEGGDGTLNGGSADSVYAEGSSSLSVTSTTDTGSFVREFSGVSTIHAGEGADHFVTSETVTLTSTDGAFETSSLQFTGMDSLTAANVNTADSGYSFSMLGAGEVEIGNLVISGIENLEGTGATVFGREGEGYSLLDNGSIQHDGIFFAGVSTFIGENATLTATAADDVFTYSSTTDGEQLNARSTEETGTGIISREWGTFTGLVSVDGNGGADTLNALAYDGQLALTGEVNTLTNGAENEDALLTFGGISTVSAVSLKGTAQAETFEVSRINGVETVEVAEMRFTGLTDVDGGASTDSSYVEDQVMVTDGRVELVEGALGSITVFDLITFTDIEAVSGSGFDIAATSGDDIFTVLENGDVSISGIRYGSFDSIDGGNGSDKVIGANSQDWTLDGLNAATNNGIAFTSVEELETINANLLGIDDATVEENFTLSGADIVTVWGMEVTGMTRVDARAGTSDLDASDYSAVLALNGNPGELSAGGSLLFTGIDSATLSSLTLSDGIDNLAVTGSQQLRVADIDFNGVSSVIDSGASDTLSSSFESDWSIANDDSLNVAHGDITFSGVETFTGGNGFLNGSANGNNFEASAQTVTVDETRIFNGVTTVIAGGGDDHLVTADTITLTDTEGRFTNGDVNFIGFDTLATSALVATTADEQFVMDNWAVSVHGLLVSGLSSLNTGAGADTITGEAGVDYLLAANGDVTHGNIVFSNTEIFIGDGAALTASDADDVFTLTAADALTLEASGQQFSGLVSADTAGGADRIAFAENYADSERSASIIGDNAVNAGGIQFSNIETLGNTGALTATEGDDYFSVVGSGTLDSGFGIRFEGVDSVAAVEGSDTVDGLASENWQLRRDEQSVFHAGIEFTGLDIANGGNGELVGSEADEQYEVTGINQLAAGGIQFGSVRQVNASEGSDNSVTSIEGETWQLGIDRSASASDAGIDFVNIDSVAGDDLHVDAATNNRSENFVLVGNVLTARGIDISSVSSVDAGLDEGDSLAANDVSQWQLDGSDGAISSAEVSFRGMDQIASENAQLHGTGNVDSFVLDGDQALTTYGMAFTGITEVSSGAGRDTLQATEGADQFALAANGDISVAGIRFGGLESVDAAGGDDTVDAEGAAWTSAANGDAYADGSALATVESIEVLFENLEQVNGTGAYTGLDIDSEYVFDSLNAMTIGGIRFAGVNSLVAGSGTDIFRAANQDTVWELNSSGGLATAGSAALQFSGFESLFAGNGADQFTLNGGVVSELDTGAGNDTVRMAGTQLGVLSLGEGDDFLQVDVAGNQEVSLTGGSGDDRFQFNVAGETWQIDSAGNRVGNLQFTGFEWLDNSTDSLTLETGLNFDFVSGDGVSAEFNSDGAGILFADSGMRLGYDGSGALNIISTATGTIGGHLQADCAELVVAGNVDITSDVHTLAIDNTVGDIDITVVADENLVIGEINAGRGNVTLNSANFGSLTAETYGDTHITAGNVQIGSDLERWSIVGSAINPLRMDVTQTAEIVSLSYFQPDFIGQMPDFTSRGDELQSVAGAQTSQGLNSAMQNVVDDFAQVDPGIFTAVNPYSAGVEVVNTREMALTDGELQPVGPPPAEEDEEEERRRQREAVPPLDAVRGGAGQ